MKTKSALVPENVLKLMSPKDRAALGKAGWLDSEIQQFADTQSEKKLQRQIANYLRIQGIAFYQNRFGKKSTGKRGQPDFICCVPQTVISEVGFYFNITHGRFVAIECKVGNNKPTAEQTVEFELIRANGGIAIVATKVEQVIDLIQKLKIK